MTKFLAPLFAVFAISGLAPWRDIPTVNAAEPLKLQRVVYDIRPLLVDERARDQLMSLVYGVFPDSWDVVGGEALQKLNQNGRLEVIQTAEAHRLISQLLKLLPSIPAQRKANRQLARDKFVSAGDAGITDDGNRLFMVIYDLADLINFECDADVGPAVLLLKERVAPDTWDAVGENGQIHAFKACQVFVISQTEEVHKELQAFFKDKRVQQRR